MYIYFSFFDINAKSKYLIKIIICLLKIFLVLKILNHFVIKTSCLDLCNLLKLLFLNRDFNMKEKKTSQSSDSKINYISNISVDILKLIAEFLSINYFSCFSLLNKKMSLLSGEIYRNKKFQENFSDLLMLLLSRNKPMFLVTLKKLILNGIITSNHIIFDESLIAHVVKDNNLDAVTFLLDKKAEVKEAKIEKGGNLLELAIQLGFPGITKKLSPYYNHKIPSKIRSTSKNHTILMQLIAEGETNIDLIKELLPTHLKENNDYELLSLAVLNKSYQITELLLDYGVKIYNDPNKSPLKIYINACDRTSFNPNDGSSIIQDYKSIDNMVSLLIKNGDKIDNIDAECIKRIFCNDEPVLARIIISHGGSAAEINIFDILIRLPKMVEYLEEAQNPETLLFWLNHLAQKYKISNKIQFRKLIEEEKTFYQWIPPYDMIGDYSLTLSFENFWRSLDTIVNYTKRFVSTMVWSTMFKHATDLQKFTNEYLMACYQNYRKKITSDPQYTSDEDNDNKPTTTPAHSLSRK